MRRPWAAEEVRVKVREAFSRTSKDDGAPATQAQVWLLAGRLEECFKGQKRATLKRHSVTAYLVGKGSCKALSRREASALLDWLTVGPADRDANGNRFALHPAARAEAAACLAAWLVQAGQLRLDL